jgi:hypothetical protein
MLKAQKLGMEVGDISTLVDEDKVNIDLDGALDLWAIG